MSAGTGALIGLVAGVGLVIALTGILASRRPRLADRIAPRPGRAAVAARGPVGTLLEIANPVAVSVTRFLGREGGTSLGRRLRQAGRPVDVQRYRLEQVLWAGGGALGGVLFIGLLAVQGRSVSGAAVLVLIAVFGVSGVVLHDRRLTSDIRKRGRRMAAQLPTVAELLAFAVSAGETPLSALDRVSRTVTGDLADEVAQLVANVRGGEAFLPALRGLADGSPSLDVARFVDGIAVATERGTPLAEVLRAQAADSRASGRRALLESAGRKEILMLLPVVFFILPIVVVIALFPGLYNLQLTVP